MRKLAAPIDDLFKHTIASAMTAADREDRMADSLAWVRDQCIFLAQHPDALNRVRREIERETRENARTAIAQDAVTRPVGGTVVSILDAVRPPR